jgi:predicted nucleotide-binding protein
MRLLRKDLKPVNLIKVNGQKYEDILMNLQSSVGKALTQAFDIPFEEGDYLQRVLQNGVEEKYQITQVNQSENVINIDIKKVTVLNPKKSAENENSIQEQLNSLIELGELAKKKDYKKPAPGVISIDYISGDTYEKWMNQTQIFNDRYLKKHTLHNDIETICKKRNKTVVQSDKLLSMLRTIADDEYFWENDSKEGEVTSMSNKVFIVHGHDDAAKYELARTLEKGGFEAIILHEQASAGMTIIEKIEAYTDVAYAVVLYTQCDLGRAKEDKVEDEKYRARQNVVFEHGYLIGKLKRDHVTALVKGDVEKPGDISGVVYTDMDAAGAWKTDLMKNMMAVGLTVNPQMVM